MHNIAEEAMPTRTRYERLETEISGVNSSFAMTVAALITTITLIQLFN
jgi:hypothetical protein